MTKILSVQSSARIAGSISRTLSAELVDVIRSANVHVDLIEREATAALPLIDESWLSANWTPKADRTAEQDEALALSEALIAELQAADIIVIGAPIYNFSIPASLKAWIDLVCRAGETFRYGESGPEGLLRNKTAYVVVASGGVPVDSAVDFATPYLRQALNFVGITDVRVISADGVAKDEDAALTGARADIAAIAIDLVTATEPRLVA